MQYFILSPLNAYPDECIKNKHAQSDQLITLPSNIFKVQFIFKVQLHYCKPLPNSNLHKTLNAYTKAHHQSCLAYNAHVSRAALTTTCCYKHNSIHFRFFNGIFNLGFLGFCRDRRCSLLHPLFQTPRQEHTYCYSNCKFNCNWLGWAASAFFGRSTMHDKCIIIVVVCVRNGLCCRFVRGRQHKLKISTTNTRWVCVCVYVESVQTLHHAYLRWLNLCGACNERRAYYDNASRWDDPTTGVLSRMSTSRERWMSNLFE